MSETANYLDFRASPCSFFFLLGMANKSELERYTLFKIRR